MSEKKSNYYKYREFYYNEKEFPHLRKTGSDVEIKKLLNKTWNWDTFNKMKKDELIKANKLFTQRANEFIRGYYESSIYKNSIVKGNRPEAPAYRNYSGLENALLPTYTNTEYRKMKRADLKRIVSESRSRLSNKTISLRYYQREFLPYLSKQGSQYLESMGILTERQASNLMRTKEFQDIYWKLWKLIQESNDYKTSKYDSDQVQNAILDELVGVSSGKAVLNIENVEDNSYYEDIKQKIIDKFKTIYESKIKEDVEDDTIASSFAKSFNTGRKG